MKLYILSDGKATEVTFAAAAKSKTHTVEFIPVSKMNTVLDHCDSIDGVLVYLDVSGMDARALRRRLKTLNDRMPHRFGIVDANGAVDDIAELFHGGAADYVGKALSKSGLTAPRLRRMAEIAQPVAKTESVTPAEFEEVVDIRPTGPDWSHVEEGQEYTFFMLYAGIDHVGDLRRKSSESMFQGLRKSFQAVLEKYFSSLGGRVYMWREDDGLMLFPFDGSSCDVIFSALRMVLNQVLINIEQLGPSTMLSWRLAFHVGNTTYKEGRRTGGIVSEAVNLIFHLGDRFVEPGGLALTDAFVRYLPDSVVPLFTRRSNYEGMDIYTLRPRA